MCSRPTLPRSTRSTPTSWPRFVTVILVGDNEAVEDVAIDTFVAAFRGNEWLLIDNKRAYLYKAAFNRALSTRRPNDRRRRRDNRYYQLTHATSPPVEVGRLSSELERLTPRQCAVDYLTFWEDRSLDEIAAMLNVSPGHHGARDSLLGSLQ